jgi:hypothetical protein
VPLALALAFDIDSVAIVAHPFARHDVFIAAHATTATIRHFALVWQQTPQPFNQFHCLVSFISLRLYDRQSGAPRL